MQHECITHSSSFKPNSHDLEHVALVISPTSPLHHHLPSPPPTPPNHLTCPLPLLPRNIVEARPQELHRTRVLQRIPSIQEVSGTPHQNFHCHWRNNRKRHIVPLSFVPNRHEDVLHRAYTIRTELALLAGGGDLVGQDSTEEEDVRRVPVGKIEAEEKPEARRDMFKRYAIRSRYKHLLLGRG